MHTAAVGKVTRTAHRKLGGQSFATPAQNLFTGAILQENVFNVTVD